MKTKLLLVVLATFALLVFGANGFRQLSIVQASNGPGDSTGSMAPSPVKQLVATAHGGNSDIGLADVQLFYQCAGSNICTSQANTGLERPYHPLGDNNLNLPPAARELTSRVNSLPAAGSNAISDASSINPFEPGFTASKEVTSSGARPVVGVERPSSDKEVTGTSSQLGPAPTLDGF